MSVFDRVAIGSPDDCWEWQGSCSSDGYGSKRVGSRTLGTHRLAWVETHGDIPDGLHVLHSCDNPPCCNPAHLHLGTHAENQREKALRRRGRTADRVGANNTRAKLTDGDVREIRRRVAAGELQRCVGERFGTTQTNVSLIVQRKAWSHVS